jgi:transposase-like protein
MAVKFTTLPKCQICTTEDAVVDGPTRQGPWAYLCSLCLRTHGRPESSMNTQLVKED